MVKIISRAEWRARRPKRVNSIQPYAVSTLHWNGPKITVGGSSNWEHGSCFGLVRGIQNFHMDGRGWYDIAYSYVVCPHGYVFEARGLHARSGANGTLSANKASYAIMYLGGENNSFTPEARTAAKEMVDYCSRRSSAPAGAKGHRDWKSTACPGDEIYGWVKAGMPTGGSSSTPAPKPEPSKPANSELRRVSVNVNLPQLSEGHGYSKDKNKATTKPHVKGLQHLLVSKFGQDVKPDGLFGDNTVKAVTNVQAFFGMTKDGIVGPKTWEVVLGMPL